MLQTEAMSKTSRKAQMWEEGLEDLVSGGRGRAIPKLEGCENCLQILYSPVDVFSLKYLRAHPAGCPGNNSDAACSGYTRAPLLPSPLTPGHASPSLSIVWTPSLAVDLDPSLSHFYPVRQQTVPTFRVCPESHLSPLPTTSALLPLMPNSAAREIILKYQFGQEPPLFPTSPIAPCHTQWPMTPMPPAPLSVWLPPLLSSHLLPGLQPTSLVTVPAAQPSPSGPLHRLCPLPAMLLSQTWPGDAPTVFSPDFLHFLLTYHQRVLPRGPFSDCTPSPTSPSLFVRRHLTPGIFMICLSAVSRAGTDAL